MDPDKAASNEKQQHQQQRQLQQHQQHQQPQQPQTEHERQVFERFGHLPKQNILLRSQVKDRKFFDSGDFAMAKATHASVSGQPRTGVQHPVPGGISHLSSPVPGDSNLEHAQTEYHTQKHDTTTAATTADHLTLPAPKQTSQLGRGGVEESRV